MVAKLASPTFKTWEVHRQDTFGAAAGRDAVAGAGDVFAFIFDAGGIASDVGVFQGASRAGMEDVVAVGRKGDTEGR